MDVSKRARLMAHLGGGLQCQQQDVRKDFEYLISDVIDREIFG